MKNHLLEKIAGCTIFAKATFYKKGSLLLVSTPLSIGVFEIFKKLIENVDYKDIVLPLVAVSICILVYSLFFIVDFISGLIASKHESEENPDWVKSEKLYTSLGKMGGVLLINIILLTINLFLVTIGLITTAKVFTVLIVGINVLASLYEFHSIGENIKRITKVKPEIFKFFERVTSVLETKILSRIGKTVEPEDNNYPEDNDPM